MTWVASIHGDADQLGAAAAREAEQRVCDALQAIADGLADAGHQGIAAEFHGSQLGQLNLLQPGDAGPAGRLVEQAPGTAAEPTGPPAEPPADGSDQEQVDAPPAALPEQSADQGTAS